MQHPAQRMNTVLKHLSEHVAGTSPPAVNHVAPGPGVVVHHKEIVEAIQRVPTYHGKISETIQRVPLEITQGAVVEQIADIPAPQIREEIVEMLHRLPQ